MTLKDESDIRAVDQQSLMTLLALDERLRSGRVPDEQILQPAETDDHILQTGMEALLELEAAIPRSSHSMPSWAPRRIGRFELRSVLGAGGFAVVYLAHDPELNRQVALKVPRPHALIQPELRQRFVNEARAAARLDHPAIVQVFEAGSDGDLPYIACALCEGPTLEDWLSSRSGPLDPRLAAEVVRRLADGLQYSHDRGILHRDIKPGNVLLFPADPVGQTEFPFQARISDFGLAKLLEDPQLDSVTSQLIGTPRFMAPELLGSAARTSSVAADVYSLGAVLYAMLTGQAPFAFASLAETMSRIASEDPIPPELINRSVGKDLSLICLKCLEKSASDRYSTAADLRDDLQRFLTGQCVSVRQTPLMVRSRKWCRRHPLGAALALVSTMFLLAIAIMTYRYTVSMKGLQNRLQDTNRQLRDRVRELHDAVELARLSQNQAMEEQRYARKLLQIADINLAGRMWRHGDTKGAESLLEPWFELLSNNHTSLTPADVALRYLWNRVTVDATLLKPSKQAVWWMHHDAASDQLLLAGSRGRLEIVSSREANSGDSQAADAVTVSPGELSCVAFSNDRKLAATSGDDGQVRIWKVDDAQGLTSQAFKLAHEIQVLPDASVYGVFFLPGTHQVVSCSHCPTLNIWDGESGQLIREISTAHPRFIESFAISTDGSQLATAGADGLLEVFRIPEFTSTIRIPASEKPLAKAAFSNDGKRLACGGWDKHVRLFDVASGRQIASYSSLSGIYCVTSNPRDEVLVGDRDGAMSLFRIPPISEIPPAGTPIPEWRPEKRWAGHDAPVSSICWAQKATTSNSSLHAPGTWISADRNGILKSWDVAASNSSVLKLAPLRTASSQPVIEACGKHLLRATEDSLEVLDRETGAIRFTRPVTASITSIAVSAESGRIVAGDAAGNLHLIRETSTGLETVSELSALPGSKVIRLYVSENGRFACAINEEWQLIVVDWATKSMLLRLENAPVAIVHPDGQHLLRTFRDHDELQVVRLSDGQVIATLKGHRSTISQLAFTTDGQTCISTSHDRTICFWNVADWSLKQQLTGHESPICRLAMSPHGDMAVTADDSGRMLLWDVRSGRELTELDERVNPILGLVFGADGTSLTAWDLSHRVYQIRL